MWCSAGAGQVGQSPCRGSTPPPGCRRHPWVAFVPADLHPRGGGQRGLLGLLRKPGLRGDECGSGGGCCPSPCRETIGRQGGEGGCTASRPPLPAAGARVDLSTYRAGTVYTVHQLRPFGSSLGRVSLSALFETRGMRPHALRVSASAFTWRVTVDLAA